MEILLTDGKHMISHGIFGVYFNIAITRNEMNCKNSAVLKLLTSSVFPYIHHNSSVLQHISTMYTFYPVTCKLFRSEQTNILKNLYFFGKARLNSIFSCETYILCLRVLLWISILFLPFRIIMKLTDQLMLLILHNAAHQSVLLPVQLSLVGNRVQTWSSKASKAHFISLMLKLCAVAN